MLDFSDLAGPLQKLDAVAERVTELKTVAAGDRDAIEDLYAALAKLSAPAIQIFHLVSNMGFRGAGAVRFILDTDMHLKISQLKPESAAAEEGFRLWNFR